jgi:hypothetical protein
MKWRQAPLPDFRQCRHGHAFFSHTENEREHQQNNRAECKAALPAELRSIAYAIERLGCRMGEDPERAILRKEALADRVRAVAAQIGGAA